MRRRRVSSPSVIRVVVPRSAFVIELVVVVVVVDTKQCWQIKNNKKTITPSRGGELGVGWRCGRSQVTTGEKFQLLSRAFRVGQNNLKESLVLTRSTALTIYSAHLRNSNHTWQVARQPPWYFISGSNAFVNATDLPRPLPASCWLISTSSCHPNCVFYYRDHQYCTFHHARFSTSHFLLFACYGLPHCFNII